MGLFPQYHGEENWLHRRDPRAKLVLFTAGAAVALLAEPVSIAVMLVVLLAHGLAAGLPPHNYKAAAMALGLTTVTLGLVQYIFNGLPGLAMAGVAALRLACFMYAFIQYIQWTHPADMALLGVKMGLPYRLAMLPVLVIRFLPVMEQELLHIYESQYVRGERFDTALQKLRGFLPVLLPLILRSLKCGHEIALAMETKAFGSAPGRTFRRDISFTAADFLWAAGLVLVSAALILA